VLGAGHCVFAAQRIKEKERKDAARLLFHCVFANSNLTRRLISAKDAVNRALNKKQHAQSSAM
jgi:hypothetical protein